MDSFRRSKALEESVIEVRNDGVHAPAADLHPHCVEEVELSPVLGARLGHLVDVTDPPEPGEKKRECVLGDEVPGFQEPQPVGAGDAARDGRQTKNGRRARIETNLAFGLVEPDAPANCPAVPARIDAENGDPPALRTKLTEDAAHDRSLSGAFAPDERSDGSRNDAKGNVANRSNPPRRGRDVVEEDGGKVGLRRQARAET